MTKQKFKINLHVHSRFSPDAVITEAQLENVFETGLIDQVAITDHNEINGAQAFQAKFGTERIIVGEEVRTAKQADVIGLFIQRYIPKGLTLERTCELIKNQNGLVYLPHPLMRKYGCGLPKMLELLEAGLIDIVEVYNGWEHFSAFNLTGRTKHNQTTETNALNYPVSLAAASDAHKINDIAKSYVTISEIANRKNLLDLLGRRNIDNLQRTPNQINASDFPAIWKNLQAKLKIRK